MTTKILAALFIAFAIYSTNTIDATPVDDEPRTVSSINAGAQSQLAALDAEGY